MLDGKKDNLNLFIERTGLVGDVAVCVSFKVKLNSCCLNSLKGSCGCACFPVGSEEACLCYAQYLVVKNALCGDPLATAKSKVGSAECNAHNGYFSISWKVKGTGSAVRKSLGIALRHLAPGKMYSAYSRCMKEMKQSPDSAVFAYVADELCKSIKAHVHCGVVGNIRLEKKNPTTGKMVPAIDIDSMLDVLKKKINVGAVKGSKTKPSEHVPCDHSDKTEISVSGWQTAAVLDYISSKDKGSSPTVCDKGISMSIKESVWETKAKKISAYVSDFVKQKHAKLGDELPAVMGYIALSNATISSHDVQQMIKARIKASDVERGILAALK